MCACACEEGVVDTTHNSPEVATEEDVYTEEEQFNEAPLEMAASISTENEREQERERNIPEQSALHESNEAPKANVLEEEKAHTHSHSQHQMIDDYDGGRYKQLLLNDRIRELMGLRLSSIH